MVLLEAGIFVAGIVLMLFVLSFFGLSEALAVAQTSDLGFLLLAIVAQLAWIALLVVRLIIVSRIHGKLSFGDSFKTVMSGLVVNYITPIARIGGEPIKVYLLKDRFGSSKATAIVATDSLVEVASSFIIVFFVFAIFAQRLPETIFSSFLIFIATALVGLIILYKVLTSPSILRRVTRWVINRVSKHKKVQKDYGKLFARSFRILVRDKETMAASLIVSFGMKFLEFARMWLVFVALGVFLPLNVVVIVWSVILILFLIPWLPGSLGLVEFGAASAFVLFGVSSSVAASGVLIDRFISFWLVLIFGFVVMSVYGISIRR